MNIAFFLTPKSEIIYATTDSTMRQVLEKMEHHTYSAIPLIEKDGRYVGTITEGDLLWKLKNTLTYNKGYQQGFYQRCRDIQGVSQYP